MSGKNTSGLNLEMGIATIEMTPEVTVNTCEKAPMEGAPRPYFDIERDMDVVKGGGIFCVACLVGRSSAEQSPDPRYCKGCYGFLLEEAALLTGTTRPRWIPRRQESGKNLIPVSGDGYTNMAHSKATENRVRHNYTVGQKRGPKPKELPEQRIEKLYQEGKGMGAERISKLLKVEGIDVSSRTVLRLLRGERQQPEQLTLPVKSR